MTNFPLVSVVIPLYNKRPYIRRAVKSVQEQKYTNWELLIVNDGSTDGSEHEIPRDDPRIRLLYQDNKGPGAARNLGISEAKGKYVSFLDADDEWLPSFLETGLELLEDTQANVTVVCTGHIKYPEKINCIEFFKNIPISKGMYEIDANSDIIQISNLLIFMWTCALVIRTDIAKKWGGFFDKFKCLRGEDTHFQLKLIFNEKIGIIPEPHCVYHAESSDLYGGGLIINSNPELVILDMDDLINSCPESKRHLLIKILLRKAIGTSISLALEGKRRKSKELLSKIYPLYHADRKKIIMARLFAEAAPILPFFRWIWRRMKKILKNRESNYQKRFKIVS